MMKRIISLLMACILCVMLVGCGSKDDGKINMPVSSKDMEGANYQEVVKKLQDVGFTNVQTKVLDDLVLGWVIKDGDIEQVTIDRNKTFSSDSKYDPKAEIIVSYHTFPKETQEKVTENKTSVETEQEPKATSITVDNNEEFAALLQSDDQLNPSIKEFATKYAGKIIEFNGNIAEMMNHEKFKTRYDFLIYVGDYSETSSIGPSFKFKDINFSDFHLTGSNIPDTIGKGDNIHIIAEVGEYNEKAGIFLIKPISTEIRK